MRVSAFPRVETLKMIGLKNQVAVRVLTTAEES